MVYVYALEVSVHRIIRDEAVGDIAFECMTVGDDLIQ